MDGVVAADVLEQEAIKPWVQHSINAGPFFHVHLGAHSQQS